MMTLVSIQKLGVEVQHIPGGCSSLCQPVDVKINRSLMANICKDWEVWMLNSEIIASTAKPQIKKLIVEWV